ncbi:unnamed protein product [Nyctereutes procyonoides]|uniref:(raccoon dog) hypothetical protein n=1 Tax=Nyctereutes procyonoides TaxID=34880 RepID=A0A811ZDH3_NYCPR|nr:unnamed protein product [Nyctereutes procyonoides]
MMGQSQSGGHGPGGGNKDDKDKKKKYEPPVSTRVEKKKKKAKGPDAVIRIKDYLLMEEEFIRNQEQMKSKVDELRGTPMSVVTLEEIVDGNHVIVSTSVGSEHYVSILSFVDKDLLEPACSILLNHKILGHSNEGRKAPQETYADIRGLDNQIQEIKESMELPLTHPEYYEEMGIEPPKGIILSGPPGTEWLALNLFRRTYSDGPKLIRELFRVAEEQAPPIVYDSNSGGEREIQRTMLELLNQLDGFDSRGGCEAPLPDEKTKKRIFQIHTSRMTFADDVTLDLIMAKDDLSGADIKHQMKVTNEDFKKSKENVLYKKQEGTPEGLYL